MAKAEQYLQWANETLKEIHKWNNKDKAPWISPWGFIYFYYHFTLSAQ
jgi:hypothetical protein